MRVYFKRDDNRTVLVEVVQFVRYSSNDTLALVMPASKYMEKKGLEYYNSTKPVSEMDYNSWCEQLMRNGYLDLTRSGLIFTAYYVNKSIFD